MAETDLSKIINLIMENPKLIEEIKNLGAGANNTEETTEPAVEHESAEATVADVTEKAENPNRIRRKELLCALKPYVSEERGRAIDSMMSIADILDMMRSR